MTATAIAPRHLAPVAGPLPGAPRMLTGDRPTGRLHLGHYAGSLANRIRLHRRYEGLFIVYDLHMLTTKNRPGEIAEPGRHATESVLDSAPDGLDPTHAVFYLARAVAK